MRRFLDREESPLKHWKLSPIDLKSLAKWDSYTTAIKEMFARTHRPPAHWTVIRSDDKKRARIAAIRTVLSAIPYEGRTANGASGADAAIAGAPGETPLSTD